jgi:AcrR family transcriptional regulator
VSARSDGEARDRILEAACFQFSHSGFDGTTMRQIADRAGVVHPLINYYFRDKDGLWRAAAEWLYGRVGRMLDAAVSEAESLDAESRLRHVLVEFVMLASESRLLTFLVETSEEGGERARWLWKRWVEPVEVRIQKTIEEAQAQGLIVKANPALLYQLLAGFSMSESARALLPRRRREQRALRARVEELVSFLMRGE